METDVLIIGSGIAGLSLALKLNDLDPLINITILSKTNASECNTKYAQGGIAAVMDEISDSFQKHIEDTLACGKGLCDKRIVEMVVKQAPERIKELTQLGIKFDHDSENKFALGLEGGHSNPRIVHLKDRTGFEIEIGLLEQIKKRNNITVREHVEVVDFWITYENSDKKNCNGVLVYDTIFNSIKYLKSTVTVLAAGGCGQLYLNTTNPIIATGDGFAIAHRAGAKIKNMRFMQFHPTALYEGINQSVSFLLSEALRGFGAHIVDQNYKRFLFAYDDRGELATRDIVCQAIYAHMQNNNYTHVYLDMRHLDAEVAKKAFSHIYSVLKKANYDPQFDLIPITPSAHYQCGGVLVNKHAQTTICKLYAVGEVAYTGLHGANRLASNSLLEALVFSHNAAIKIKAKLNIYKKQTSINHPNYLSVRPFINKLFDQHILKIKTLTTQTAFSENKSELINANKFFQQIIEATEKEIANNFYSNELQCLRNMALTASLILTDKLQAKEQKNTNHFESYLHKSTL